MKKNSIYKSESGKKQIQVFYDEILKDWNKPSKHHYLETEFGKTFIIESGSNSNPVILLLHGTGSNSAMWTADVKTLSKDYHVFAIDIIGECGKSAENRPSFKENNYSDWLLEITKKLQIKKTSIIGCSLGSWIALDFSIKHPEKVKKLVLLTTAGITQVKVGTIFLIMLTSIAGNWGFRKLNKMVYGNIKIDSNALEFISLVKNYFKPRTDVLPIFSDEQLCLVNAKVLFIGGDMDCFYDSQKTASRLAKNVKHLQYLILEKTGHVLLNQTGRIAQFLKDKNSED